jgi:hypothetical protein
MPLERSFKSLLLIAGILLLGLPGVQAGTVLDPRGDTFGSGPIQHDILSITSTVGGTSTSFAVAFDNSVFAPSSGGPSSVVGFLDIDVDRNRSTGITSSNSSFATSRGGVPVLPGLGIEYYLDLFGEISHPGSVDIINAATRNPVGTAPIVFDSQTHKSFSIVVTNSLLGISGPVNYGVQVGTFDELTDVAADISSPSAVPEPGGLVLVGPLVIAALAYQACRRLRRLDSITKQS